MAPKSQLHHLAGWLAAQSYRCPASAQVILFCLIVISLSFGSRTLSTGSKPSESHDNHRERLLSFNWINWPILASGPLLLSSQFASFSSSKQWHG